MRFFQELFRRSATAIGDAMLIKSLAAGDREKLDPLDSRAGP
jgi:hypothetical protein